MEKTTVEQLIEDCYKIAKLGNIHNNMEVNLLSDGQFRVSMHYDYADNVCLASALAQLKENLIVKAKPIMEKSLQDTKSTLDSYTKYVSASNEKLQELEEALSRF